MLEPGTGGLIFDGDTPQPVSFVYRKPGEASGRELPGSVFDDPRRLPPEAGVISAGYIKRKLALASGPSAHVDGDAHVTKRKKRQPQEVPSLIPLDRGGPGGRQRRPRVFDESTATRELLNELGEPRHIPGLRCKMLVWERAGGDGIVVGRMSGAEVQNGETGLGQLRSVLDLVNKEHINWRYMVLTLENSGFRDYEDRPDCQFIREAVETGEARWVAWRSIDRMAREFLPAEQQLSFLQRTGTDLYLHQFGRKVDWAADAIQIRALLLAAFVEGKAIRDRTHGAIERRWLEEGRGYPGAKRFATQRDPLTRFLVEDPAQMHIVHWLHDHVAGLGDENVVKYGSLRKLSDALKAELDVSISHTTIGRILRDPIYLPTGEWWVRYGGTYYAGQPMKWTTPVPYAKYMETQRLLGIRAGARTANTEGDFVLNGILYHAACMNDRTEKGGAYKLRAAARRGKTPRYHHSPKAAPQCPRYSISARTIEPVVMRELRRLLRTPELETAWKEAARQFEAEPTKQPAEDQIPKLTVERDNLRRSLKELEERAVTMAAAGELDVNRHDRLISDIEARISGVEARIKLAEDLSEQHELRDQLCTPGTSLEELRSEAEELLTDEVPDDPRLAVARKALVQSLLSAVILHDTDDGMKIELQGWLVPPGATPRDLPAAVQVAEAAITAASGWPVDSREPDDSDHNASQVAESDAFQPEQKPALAFQLEPGEERAGSRDSSSTPPARRSPAQSFTPLLTEVTAAPYCIDGPPLPDDCVALPAPLPRRSPLVRLSHLNSWKRHWGGRPAFRSPLVSLGRDLRRWQQTPEGLAAARAAMRLVTAELYEWEPAVSDRRYDEIAASLNDRFRDEPARAALKPSEAVAFRDGRLVSCRNVRHVCSAHGIAFTAFAVEAWSEMHPAWPIPGRRGDLSLGAIRAALSAALERLPESTTSLSQERYEHVRRAHPDLRLPCFRQMGDVLRAGGGSIFRLAGELVAASSQDGVVKTGKGWEWPACVRAVELVTRQLGCEAPIARIRYDRHRPSHYPHSSAIARCARRRGLEFCDVAAEAHAVVGATTGPSLSAAGAVREASAARLRSSPQGQS